MHRSRLLYILLSAFLAFDLVISTSPANASTPDGTLDTSFGTSGFTTNTSGTDDSVRSIALDSQGRIVAGGYSKISGVDKFTIARYTSSGVLDTTFGTSGFTTTTPGTSGTISSIALDSQGRIIAAGTAVISGVNKFAIARYTSSGVLDATFGTSGFTTTTPGTSDSVRSIALDNQERIIAGGLAVISGVNKFAIARYTSSGVLDTTFGTSGFTTTTPGTNDAIYSITLDSQERIIAGGQATIGGPNKFALARYTSAGVLDATFGTSGYTTTTPGTDDGIYSVTVDNQGQIIAGGGAKVSGVYKFALARYATNGALDTSFGVSGFNTVTPGTNDGMASIAIDGKGRIIGSGVARMSGVDKFALARYTSSGVLDTSFGTSGFTTTTPGSNDGILAIARDNQGSIIAGGHSRIGGANKFALSRYLILGVPIFSLSPSSESVYIGNALSGYSITSTGGEIASYAITPAAPAGVTFSAITGQLSGTPTSTKSATAYTITATNSSGDATATFTLTVTNKIYVPTPPPPPTKKQPAMVLSAENTALGWDETTTLKLIGGVDSGTITYQNSGDTLCIIDMKSSTLVTTSPGNCIITAYNSGDFEYIPDRSNEIKIFVYKDLPATIVIPKPMTITCLKGKISKRVTAINPKCPTGYLKKRSANRNH